MTKKKFISDYTEKFWFYMLEWESDGNAVKKVLGDVYDKMKRPTRREYDNFCFDNISDIYTQRLADWSVLWYINSSILDEVYKKYLSDSNGWGETTTVSE